jgi:hypothetical protein
VPARRARQSARTRPRRSVAHDTLLVPIPRDGCERIRHGKWARTGPSEVALGNKQAARHVRSAVSRRDAAVACPSEVDALTICSWISILYRELDGRVEDHVPDSNIACLSGPLESLRVQSTNRWPQVQSLTVLARPQLQARIAYPPSLLTRPSPQARWTRAEEL